MENPDLTVAHAKERLSTAYEINMILGQKLSARFRSLGIHPKGPFKG